MASHPCIARTVNHPTALPGERYTFCAIYDQN